MAREQLTVKILKSRTDVLWYRNKIDQTFKVREANSDNEGRGRYEIYMGEGKSRIIYKEDCELI